MKTEPEAFSIDDLRRKKVEQWDGVRNFQARNYMRDMAAGDMILLYHSGKAPAVAGVAKVAKVAHPDQTQFDPKSHYYEPRATKEKPVWYCVDVRFVRKFTEPISLARIKADRALGGMLVRERGSRLSVQPVSKEHFTHITSLAP